MCVCKYNNNISMFISTGKQFQQKQAWLWTQIKTLLIIQQTLGHKTLYLLYLFPVQFLRNFHVFTCFTPFFHQKLEQINVLVISTCIVY